MRSTQTVGGFGRVVPDQVQTMPVPVPEKPWTNPFKFAPTPSLATLQTDGGDQEGPLRSSSSEHLLAVGGGVGGSTFANATLNWWLWQMVTSGRGWVTRINRSKPPMEL